MSYDPKVNVRPLKIIIEKDGEEIQTNWQDWKKITENKHIKLLHKDGHKIDFASGTLGKKKYPKWTLIDWDGNPALKYKCWRKSFGNGHVSVGVGEFDLIVFDYGANSDHSYSATRWMHGHDYHTEEEAMKAVDRGAGKKPIWS